MRKFWPRAVLAALFLTAAATTPAAEPVVFSVSGDELEETGELDAASALALDRSEVFRTVDGSILIHSLPALTLLDGRRFSIAGGLARMGMTPVDLFPVAFLQAVQVQRPGAASVSAGSDAVWGTVDLRRKTFSSGGEVGVFYGKSSGRYGREDFENYIVGGITTDKFQISAGASYQNSSGRIPRSRP